MRYLLAGVLVLCVCVIAIKLGSIPDDYPAYPEEIKADVMLYNDATHGDINTSELVFNLQTSFGVCDKVGSVRIVKNGGIGVCTGSGWKIHQTDE
jgi:hypothetical protein